MAIPNKELSWIDCSPKYSVVESFAPICIFVIRFSRTCSNTGWDPREFPDDQIFLIKAIRNPLLYMKMWWKWTDTHAAVLWMKAAQQSLILCYLKFVQPYWLLGRTGFLSEEIGIWECFVLCCSRAALLQMFSLPF